MIARLVLFATLVGLLAWIPMASPRGFGGEPIIAVALLGAAALAAVFRRKPGDD